MKFLNKFVRPKARFRLGQRYLGKSTSLIAKGYVIFKEWDQTDGKFYYWEEWELTGFNNYDSWVEYDHYNQNVTVYEPVRVPERYDVQSLAKGAAVTVTINKQLISGIVDEVGTGTVVKLRGKMSYQLFSDDIMHYAEVKTGPTTVVSIEDYRQVGDTDYDYYSGRRLNKAEQKLMFGKVISPLNIKLSTIIYSIFFVGFLVLSFLPHYNSVCTPRTTTPATTSPGQRLSLATSASQASSSRTTPNSYPQQDCRRVRVYGSGGGGVGK